MPAANTATSRLATPLPTTSPPGDGAGFRQPRSGVTRSNHQPGPDGSCCFTAPVRGLAAARDTTDLPSPSAAAAHRPATAAHELAAASRYHSRRGMARTTLAYEEPI